MRDQTHLSVHIDNRYSPQVVPCPVANYSRNARSMDLDHQVRHLLQVVVSFVDTEPLLLVGYWIRDQLTMPGGVYAYAERSSRSCSH